MWFTTTSVLLISVPDCIFGKLGGKLKDPMSLKKLNFYILTGTFFTNGTRFC